MGTAKLKGTTKFPSMYRGQVFDNADPLQQGRIKVQVWPMMSEIIDPDLLPWAVPAMPLWGGAGDGFGMMAIPAIGTHVFCFFEAGDPYQPVYFAEAQNAVAGIPAEVAGNYPNTRVMKSPSGVKIIVDDVQGSIQIVTPLQSTLVIDQTGKITISSVAGMDLSAVVDIVANAGGLIALTATGAVNVIAGANSSVNVVGTLNMSSTGDSTLQSGGIAKVQATGKAQVIGSDVEITGTGFVKISGATLGLYGVVPVPRPFAVPATNLTDIVAAFNALLVDLKLVGIVS